jgi:hypothetical protein
MRTDAGRSVREGDSAVQRRVGRRWWSGGTEEARWRAPDGARGRTTMTVRGRRASQSPTARGEGRWLVPNGARSRAAAAA